MTIKYSLLSHAAYAGLVLFAAVVILNGAGAPVFADPDTAWHLAAGDWMRAHHALPERDPWSFSASDERWYDLSWLFDVALSVAFHVGGFSLIYAVTLLVFGIGLAAMARHCLARGVSPLVLTALLPLMLLAMIYQGVLARPNLASILLTLFFYCRLQRYRAGMCWRVLWPLPLAMALWANLHGGFLLAFLLIAVFAFEALCERKRATLQGYGVLAIACLAASLCNPYGFVVYYGALKSLNGTFDHTYLLEWQPVVIGGNRLMTGVLFLVLLLRRFDKRVPLADTLLAAALVLMAFSSIRHAIIAGFLLLPYLGLAATHLMQASPLGAWCQQRDARISADMERPDMRVLAGIAVALALLLLAIPPLRDVTRETPLGFPKDRYPVQEAAYIAAHYPNLRFFNDYNIGGYLLYLWQGKMKLFVDGRSSSLYSPELLQDYARFMSTHGFGGRSQVTKRYYGLQGIIVSNASDHAGEFSWNPDWRVVFHGPVATVYVSKDAGTR